MVDRISGQPPVAPRRTERAGQSTSTEGPARSGKTDRASASAPTTAAAPATSPTSSVRAEIGPAHRALGASQDAVTFVQSADAALGEIERLLSATAADPSTAAGNLAEIERIASSTTMNGQQVLANFRTAPISFGGGPTSDGFAIEADLRISLDGSDGILSVDLVGAGPDHVSAVSAAAAAQVALTRAELGGIEEELRTEALGLASEVAGPTHDLEHVRRTLDKLVATLQRSPGVALAAQGRVDTQAAAQALSD